MQGFVQQVILMALMIAFGAYGLTFPTEPLGIIALATAAIILAGNCALARYGMGQPRGRRFYLGWTFFQNFQHARRLMAADAAAAAWADLGCAPGNLVGGLECNGHCDERLLVGESNGRRYYVWANQRVDAPFALWSVGWIFVRGRDLPFTGDPPRSELSPPSP